MINSLPLAPSRECLYFEYSITADGEPISETASLGLAAASTAGNPSDTGIYGTNTAVLKKKNKQQICEMKIPLQSHLLRSWADTWTVARTSAFEASAEIVLVNFSRSCCIFARKTNHTCPTQLTECLVHLRGERMLSVLTVYKEMSWHKGVIDFQRSNFPEREGFAQSRTRRFRKYLAESLPKI